jgi:hypothetical protein
MLAVSLDAALNQLAVFGDDTDLAGNFTEIETDEVHSCSPFHRGLLPQIVRSSMPLAEWQPVASSNLNCGI